MRATTWAMRFLSPDVALAAFAGYADGRVQVWSVAENKLLFELIGHTAMALDVKFSPEGSQIASTSEDGTLRFVARRGWLVCSTCCWVIPASSGWSRTLRMENNWPRSETTPCCVLWDPAAGTLINAIPTQKGDWPVTTLTYASDGQSVYLTYNGANWDQSTGGLFRVDLQTGQIETLLGLSHQ